MFIVIKEIDPIAAIEAIQGSRYWMQLGAAEEGKRILATGVFSHKTSLRTLFRNYYFGQLHLIAHLPEKTLELYAPDEEGFKLALRDIGQGELIDKLFHLYGS